MAKRSSEADTQFDLFKPRPTPVERPATPPPVARVTRKATPAPNVVEPTPQPLVQVIAQPKVYTVGELTREIRGQLEDRFQRVAVQGEISNLTRPPSGHVYFTLKDADATISAVLFRNQARLLKFDLQAGQQVVCKGRITLYPPRGQYQLACDTIEPVGLGALAVAFEQLKSRLQSEGLFDPSRKRPIPMLPRRIGVVTSPSGAAVRDFLRVLHQRYPELPVLIAPARVQGDGAASEVAAGIRKLCAWSANRPARERLDVIVVTRGGGSLEDLWAFNEEVLAKAIAQSPIPIVSAVGHEVDFTIADFVADLRCPTPTAAAERLAPVKVKEQELLAVRRRRLHKAIERTTSHARHALLQRRQKLGDPRHELSEHHLALDARADALEKSLRLQLRARTDALGKLKERLHRAHPRQRLLQNERALRELRDRLLKQIRFELLGAREALTGLRERLVLEAPRDAVQRAHRQLAERGAALGALQQKALAARRLHFDAQKARLDALSPLKVMNRGYAIAFGPSGAVLRKATDVKAGEGVRVRLADQAELETVVQKVRGPSVE
ncbi:MAG: exodeoxyribonuclease VII large subunit [Deltaproteobacteria bacterium]|nr:exodeoxyribonuclease VII large subunit [Deltaproteobacteria bacterium]